MSKATDYLSRPPTLCVEPTTPLQIACAASDLAADLSSLGVGLDILNDDAPTRRQQFLIAALLEKLATIITSAEELARRADDVRQR
jgi:hypothetical protein